MAADSDVGLISGGVCLGQERWRVPARSTAPARLCHRRRRSAAWMASGAFGVASFAVAADDLYAWAGIQPGAEGFGGPFGEVVDRSAGTIFTSKRCRRRGLCGGQSRRLPAPRGLRLGHGADEPQRRRRLAAQASVPLSRAPARSPRARHCLQAAGPAAVAGGQARHLLGERRLSAAVVTAEEPAGVQVNQHLLAAAGAVSASQRW